MCQKYQSGRAPALGAPPAWHGVATISPVSSARFPVSILPPGSGPRIFLHTSPPQRSGDILEESAHAPSPPPSVAARLSGEGPGPSPPALFQQQPCASPAHQFCPQHCCDTGQPPLARGSPPPRLQTSRAARRPCGPASDAADTASRTSSCQRAWAAATKHAAASAGSTAGRVRAPTGCSCWALRPSPTTNNYSDFVFQPQLPGGRCLGREKGGNRYARRGASASVKRRRTASQTSP